MKTNTFTCYGCGGTFTKARPPGEANAEAEELWGVKDAEAKCEAGRPDEDVGRIVVVCDDCFQEFMQRKAQAGNS